MCIHCNWYAQVLLAVISPEELHYYRVTCLLVQARPKPVIWQHKYCSLMQNNCPPESESEELRESQKEVNKTRYYIVSLIRRQAVVLVTN